MKAAIYCRVSTDEQASHGHSLDEQERLRRAYVEAEKGWTLDEADVFIERGVSGTKSSRPQLDQLRARASEFNVIVFPSFDRLGRSSRDLLNMYEEFERAGAAPVFLREKVDATTPVGRLLRTVLSAIAEFERDLTAQRTRSTLQARKRAGVYIGGRVLGYRRTTGEGLEVVEAEAAIVRRIFAEFLAGRAKIAIARGLQDDGVPTVRADKAGSKWYASTVTGILQNPAYAGLVRSEGELIAGGHDAILDMETWTKAVELREGRVTYEGRPKGRRAVGAHLLTEGLLRCHCGAPMTPETRRSDGHEYQTYRCSRGKTHPGDCEQRTIRRERANSAIYAFQRVAHDEDKTRNEFRKRTGLDLGEAQALLEQADREIAKCDARLARITQDYWDEKLPVEDYNEQKAELMAERVAAEAQAEQHRRHCDRAQMAISALDTELQIARRLTLIRQTIAGEITNSSGDLDALRATLRRLFTGFVLMSPKARAAPLVPIALQPGRPWEEWPDLADGYALAPFVREDAWFMNPSDHPDPLGIWRQALPLVSIDTHSTAPVTFT